VTTVALPALVEGAMIAAAGHDPVRARRDSRAAGPASTPMTTKIWSLFV